MNSYLISKSKKNKKRFPSDNSRWKTRANKNKNKAKIRRDNTSGYKGVSWDEPANLWIVGVTVNRVRKHIGYYKDAKEGAKAYNQYVIDNDIGYELNSL